MADSEFDTMTPELYTELAGAADFLLPVAQAHVDLGKWPIQVSAWLIMMREECSMKAAQVH